MRHERILLILILSELMLIVPGAVVESALEPTVFGELQAYVSSRAAAPPRVSGPLLTALWWVVAISTLLSWIGLLDLLSEARWLYVGSWLGYLVLIFLRGPGVDTALGSVIQMLTGLVGGGILGTIYFSELRTKFRPLGRQAAAASQR